MWASLVSWPLLRLVPTQLHTYIKIRNEALHETKCGVYLSELGSLHLMWYFPFSTISFKFVIFFYYKSWIKFQCVNTDHFIVQSAGDRHLSWFHLLVIVNQAETSMDLHISLWWDVEFLGWMPRSGTTGFCDISIFSFIRKLYRNFHNHVLFYIPTNSEFEFPFHELA